MKVNTATAKHHLKHDGTDYYFCGGRCRVKFEADPDAYLKPQEKAPTAEDAAALYTCPMHPEIRQTGPGSCPICGMALEPVEITAEAAPNLELADMSRRFWIALGLTIPVFLLDMLGPRATWSTWVQAVLATPVVLWAGAPFFMRFWASVRSGHLNMFTLIALGTGAAYLDSVVATIAPGLFPAGFRGGDQTVPVYYESAAVITVLVLLGQVLELRARDQTGGAIRALLNLTPKQARRVRDGAADEEIALDDVKTGDHLRVRPGESVPVDGTVIDGKSAIDESMVTGESMAVPKAQGDSVIGGTLNGAGALIIRADKIGQGTMLARIVSLVAEAQRSRAPIQRLADRVAGIFVPVVLAIALGAAIIWAIWGPPPSLGHALIAAVSVLIIACPCALGLATPMSIMVGIGKGAGAGILIKSADALERLETIDTLVVDKTGTLTEGKPKVTSVIPYGDWTEPALLRLAASLEQSSEHPLAAAILTAANDAQLEAPRDFATVTGKGITGMVGQRRVVLGTARLLSDNGINAEPLSAKADTLRQDGATALFIGIDGTLGGVIAIADPIKPSTREALDRLRADHIHIVMLTGDNRVTADAVGHQLGIDKIQAEILPEDKQRIVATLQGEGKIVAMAGDGVNDAPALAAADIGIAMGGGTEIAIESAGVTLLNGDLAAIARARALSRMTMRNIRQNLAFAFAYNAIGIPIAAGVLYPAFGWVLSPMLAALAMSLSSVSVIANALRLRMATLK